MLFRKVLRDLKENAVQFLAIFVMTMIALLISSGFDASDKGVLDSGSEYLADVNFKDMDVSGSLFGNDAVTRLRGMDGIAHVDGIYHATGKAVLDKERPLLISYVGSNDVSRMMLTEGTAYTPGTKGVWVEELFARPMGIRPGDTLTIISEGVTFKEEVKGLVYSPEYIYYVPNSTYYEPEYGTHGFVIMDISEAPEGRGLYDQLIIDLADVSGQGNTLTEAEKAICRSMRSKVQDKLEDPTLLVRIKTEDDSYDGFVGSADSNAAMSVVFPFVFLSVAFLGIISTMTRLTAKQRTQIGTLKALGFSRAKITVMYLSYSAGITLLGCVCGIIVGRNTLGQYLNDMMDYYYQNPYTRLENSSKVVWMTVAAVGLCILVTYICTRSILIQNAADILRPEPPKVRSAGRLELSRMWDTLKFISRWNLRDVMKNRLRTVMSLLGIVICSMLLFCAVGFYECLKVQSEWMYGELIRARYRITYEEGVPYGTVYDHAKEYSGQMAEEINATVYGRESDSVRLFTVLDDGNLYRLEDEDLESASLPVSGVAVTSRLADALELEWGDMITWKVAGSNTLYTARIMLICRQASDQGILVSRSVWEDMGGEFKPNMILTNMTVPASLKNVKGVDTLNTTEELKRTLEQGNAVGYTASGIIIALAVAMGLVVLYNLGILSYSEKIREIATMKVLGFQSLDIRLMLMQQNLCITALGAVAGIPLGKAVLAFLLDIYMGDGDDMIIRVTANPYLTALVGTFAVSLLVNVYVTSRVNGIDMVDSLKGVE